MRLRECEACAEDAPLASNDGWWSLCVSKGEGRLLPANAGRGDAVDLGIGAFASLYTGWAQSATLERAGLLRGGSAETRALLDAAFAGPTPWMPEEF